MRMIDLVCYGGIGVSELSSQILATKNVKSIAFGNILNGDELKFQEIKKSIKYSKKILDAQYLGRKYNMETSSECSRCLYDTSHPLGLEIMEKEFVQDV